MMDLSRYSMEELILTALRSEIEAKEFYTKLSGIVENSFLKDRLMFLAGEEDKHRAFFEATFKGRFPGKEMRVPKDSPVPLPKLTIESESMPASEVFYGAMQAEKAASEFYRGIAEKMTEGSEEIRTLLYIANMEMGHYYILDNEREGAVRGEDFDVYWEMEHAGP
jgi:rubrerythrin